MLKKCFYVFAFYLFIGLSIGQYYYFSPEGEYNQGCDESMDIIVDVEGHNPGANAGAIFVKLDETVFDFETSTSVSQLRSNLFTPGVVFADWSSAVVPAWSDLFPGEYVLRVDRATDTAGGGSRYVGTDGVYGTLIDLNPKYSVTDYTGVFYFEYNGSTNLTFLSDGTSIIDDTNQLDNLTGEVYVHQKPCSDDSTAPTINVLTPNGTNRVTNNGLNIELRDDIGNGSVPYVFNVSDVWTGNPGGITNQVGIDLNELSITVAGNLNSVTLTQGDLDQITDGEKTWEYEDRGYDVSTGSLFDFGIEEAITITAVVKDRAGNTSNFGGQTFNSAEDPIITAISPTNGDEFIQLTENIVFTVTDAWAGVDTGSIVVTLSGVNVNASGYNYDDTSGILGFVQLSGAPGTGNSGGYTITLSGMPEFPTSADIKVTVQGQDLKDNTATDSWTFTTRPDCDEIGCCDGVLLQTGLLATPFGYNNSVLYISGGINPDYSRTSGNFTGYIDCDNADGGISLYSGDENVSTFLSYEELTSLYFSGQNVKAILTGTNGDTIILYRFGNFVIKVYPGTRVDQDNNKSNIGELRLYDMSHNLQYSGTLSTNDLGTGEYIEDIPTQEYFVVYKGQSHLASYISGIVLTGGDDIFLDFTTGVNLYSTQTKTLETDDGYRYQIAGDMKDADGKYDGDINGFDLSIVLFYGYGSVSDNHAGDLDNSGNIGVSDIGIIGSNFGIRGIFHEIDGTLSW